MKTSRLAFLSQMAHDFGGVVRFTVPGRTIYLVSEPLAARHILATNAGNYSKGLGQREATSLLATGVAHRRRCRVAAAAPSPRDVVQSGEDG